eukprot:1344020-Amphidinium_carterae.1
MDMQWPPVVQHSLLNVASNEAANLVALFDMLTPAALSDAESEFDPLKPSLAACTDLAETSQCRLLHRCLVSERLVTMIG